jgi:hypothetical protein
LFHYNIGEKPFFLCHSIDSFPANFERLSSKTGIDTLPTQSSLTGYRGCCEDGTVYFFEIATKNSYKFCVYENPDCCKDNIEKNQQFIDFLRLFETKLPDGEMCWPLCIIRKSEKN